MASVSVIIPSFNCGEFLQGAVSSILKQCQRDLEIVIVDDASTDGTRQTVAALEPSVKYIRNSVNRGVSYSRNRGIERSSGEYIAFLDADDEWLPEKLALQMSVLENNCDIVSAGGAMLPFESAHLKGLDHPTQEFVRCCFDEMVMRNRLATPTVIVRRDALERAGAFDETLTICEDYDLWLRLARIGPIARLSAPLARYRTRPAGLSAGNPRRTYDMHCEYVRSLPKRFADVPGIGRLARIHLAQFALERSIEDVDVIGNCLGGMTSLAESFWHWPLPLPTANRTMLRALRLAHTVRRAITGPKPAATTGLQDLPTGHA